MPQVVKSYHDCMLPSVVLAVVLLHAQMEYVRADKQVRVLRHLQEDAAALAVALPGAQGRSLHARGQDTVRCSKLIVKLGGLMTKLGIKQPLQPGSNEYKQGLAALRDEELRSLQADIEKQVSALAVIKHERQQQGAANSITRSQRKMAQNRRKRVRELAAIMHSWQVVDAPSSSVLAQLPNNWTEQEVNNLFKGEYPWRQGQPGLDPVAAVLAEQYMDACAEVTFSPAAGCLCRCSWWPFTKHHDPAVILFNGLQSVLAVLAVHLLCWLVHAAAHACSSIIHHSMHASCCCAVSTVAMQSTPTLLTVFCCIQEARTIEELVMQHFERERTKQYFAHVRDVCSAASTSRHAIAEGLLVEATEQLPTEFDSWVGYTASVLPRLQQHNILSAEAVLLRRVAEQHQEWYDAAVRRFAILSP